MRFATYIFDAILQQGPSDIVFLHFARPVPSEMKIVKINPTVVLGRPGGMRGGAGGDMRGSEICKFEICVMDSGFGFDTPCLGFRPRAADSIAPRIPPGQDEGNGKWEVGNGKWEMGNGTWEMGDGKLEMRDGKIGNGK